MSFFQDRKWIMYGVNCWPIIATPFGVSAGQTFKGYFGTNLEGLGIFEGVTMEWFYDERQLRLCAERMLPILLEQQWKYYDTWMLATQPFVEVYDRLLGLSLKDVSDEELKQLAKTFYERFLHEYTVSNIIEPLSAYFQTDLASLLETKGCTKSDADRLIHEYGVAARPNYLKNVLEEYAQAKTPEQINAVIHNYCYINNDYSGRKPFTRADLEALAKKELPQVQETPSQAPAEARPLLEALQIVATIQDVRKAYSLMWVEGCGRILEEYARRLSIPYEDLLCATWDEVVDDKIKREDLVARKQIGVIHWDEQGTHVYTGEEALRIKAEANEYLLRGQGTDQTISGFIACPGKITGRAVVILDPSQAPPMKAGDILVTMMTRPEFLPLMHIASAFVTDEGGITSHAAIVAREMKKPCLIGTKIATKLIRTGQIIEVDAEKGIVRILK